MHTGDFEFSQKELLAAVKPVGLTADRYNNWERPGRGIMPVVRIGSGNKRKYAVKDVAYLGLVTVLSARLPHLAVAAKMGGALSDSIVETLTRGDFDKAPIFVIYEDRGWKSRIVQKGEDLNRFFQLEVHPRYAPAVVVHSGQLAMELAGGLDDVLAQREGFENRLAQSKAKQNH